MMENVNYYLEIITCPPSRYQVYRPGSSIFARGPLCPRANMECRADMPGNATVDMFFRDYHMSTVALPGISAR